MDKLNIAFVKSFKYQDLWIHDITNDPFILLKTTTVRVPPLALAEKFNTDFIIIKDPSEESKIFDNTDFNPFEKENKLPSLNFLHNEYHNHTDTISISHNTNDINWAKYNIVICMNMCIPSNIISKFPNILWSYYISENFNNDDTYMRSVFGNYDIFLNQQVHLQSTFPSNVIGFPYSFLHPDSLKDINIKYLDNIQNKHGIFIEINNNKERPCTTILPEFKYLEDITRHNIILHNQNILENVKNIYKSKYFVKILGRVIRGNAALEAISCGSLVLINKELIMYADLIPDICNVKTPEDVSNIILKLDNNDELYKNLLQEQRERMMKYYYEEPLSKLYTQYLSKNAQTRV